MFGTDSDIAVNAVAVGTAVPRPHDTPTTTAGKLSGVNSRVPAVVRPVGVSHIRLTVTDIHRSKAFYSWLFGRPPRSDFSDRVDEPGVREDPQKTYGGCSFTVGQQVLGLRPVAAAADRFVSTRVGLDHLCLLVDHVAELHHAAARLDEAGVEHGDVTDLPAFGLTILSLQDPDDINLELAAPLPDGR